MILVNIIVSISLFCEGIHLIGSSYQPTDPLDKDWGIAWGVLAIILSFVPIVIGLIRRPKRSEEHKESQS
jgi:hypothetical protein